MAVFLKSYGQNHKIFNYLTETLAQNLQDCKG